MTTIVEDLVPEIVVEVSDIALKGDPGEQGIQGIAGPAVTLTVGSVTEVAPGSASASITGTSPDLFLNLELPVGVTEEDFTIALDSLTALVNGKATPSDIATAITALSLGTASQHDVSYFARPSDVTNAVASEATARTNAISSAIGNLVNSAPGLLDTLGEIATRITDDETGVAAILATVTAVQTALATKAPLASPVLTGTPTAPTTATSDNSTKLATTAFVKAVVSALSGDYVALTDGRLTDQRTPIDASVTVAKLSADMSSRVTGGLGPNVLPSGDTSGVTDSAAIQALIDAGTTVVLFPQGLYWTRGITLRTGVHVYFNSATVKAPAAANTDVFIGNQFASLTGTSTNGGIHDFGLHGPGRIDGNKGAQTITNPTVASSAFNLSASFTVQLSSTAGLGSTGTATVNTQSGPQLFSWSANNTGTNTLTCSATGTGRVANGAIVCTTGFGVRFYGWNFRIGDGLIVRNCVADGIWSEWAPSIAVGSGSDELEALFTHGKCIENGRNGHSFLGPHDSMIDRWVNIRNGSRGFVTGNSSIAYLHHCHGWGAPQVISFDDHTGCTYTNCVGEMTNVSGSRSWVLWAGRTILSGCYVLWGAGGGGSAGNVGIEFQNSAGGCLVDAQWQGGFGNGAVLFTSTGGGNVVRGTAVTLGSNPIVAGTPDPTDVIDIVPGPGTTTARYCQGVVRSVVAGSAKMTIATDATGAVTVDTNLPGPADHGFAGWAFDPAVSSSHTAVSSGAILYVRVKATDTRTVTKLWVGVGSAGSTLTSGQSLLGLYDATGNQLAVSGDQSGAWLSTGAKSATITGVAVTAGATYYIAILSVGTTPPSLLRGYSAVAAAANAGYAAAPFRFNQGATGQVTLPATVTLASLTTALAWWAAMS